MIMLKDADWQIVHDLAFLSLTYARLIWFDNLQQSFEILGRSGGILTVP